MDFHFITDDKFIDNFVRSREDYFTRHPHVFVIAGSAPGGKLQFVSHPFVLKSHISLSDFRKKHLRPGRIPDSSRIFVHFLHRHFYKSLLSIPRNVPVHWIFYGADFYTPLSRYIERILDPKTAELYYSNARIRGVKIKHYLPFPVSVQKKILSFVHQFVYDEKRKRNVIARVDFFLHWNEKDYYLVRATYQSDMKFLFFRNATGISAYPTHLLATETPEKRNRTGILFGNSAHYTNNHLDGLDVLSEKIGRENARIYCPLSYGPEDVVSAVTSRGTSLYGDSFIPQEGFMPNEEYWDFINDNIDLLFMNQKRTQAVGNINRCIFLGKKVYMRRESTLYQFLRENGILVFSIEDDFLGSSTGEILAPLSDHDKEQNRTRLLDTMTGEREVSTNMRLFGLDVSR